LKRQEISFGDFATQIERRKSTLTCFDTV